VTPTDNPEAAGSNGTPASPPWQRVDKEGDAEATVKLATEEGEKTVQPSRQYIDIIF